MNRKGKGMTVGVTKEVPTENPMSLEYAEGGTAGDKAREVLRPQEGAWTFSCGPGEATKSL